MYCCKCRPDIHTYIHTYIHTWLHAYKHVYSMWISLLLSLWLLSPSQEHADSMYVCMYGCVSDRRGPRLCTRLLRRGIVGRWRSSWTIPRTRRPSSRYEEAVTATYRWNHLRPNLPYSVLHSYIRTYVHTLLFPMFGSLAKEMPSFSHPYIQVRMSSCTHMYMHTVYVCLNVCTYYVYMLRHRSC
jgi:hypothetical protein